MALLGSSIPAQLLGDAVKNSEPSYESGQHLGFADLDVNLGLVVVKLQLSFVDWIPFAVDDEVVFVVSPEDSFDNELGW